MALPPKQPASELRRLPPESYRGLASVHWTMTIHDRATGWLGELHHSRLREALLHTGSRYRLLCPVYCLMPDHGHFVWMSVASFSDQLRAVAFFRRCWNEILRGETRPCQLQKQAYDHVLSQDESEEEAFASTCTYILQNPVRGGLVETMNDWAYLGAVLPGYPRLDPREASFWDRFWTIRREVLE